MKKQKTVFELHADLCKVMSSPKRIEIINALKDSEKSVLELVNILGTPKANVSQHLSVMRLKGILKSRREGVNVYYSIANPKIITACSIMRELLFEILSERDKVAQSIPKF
ncbi:MAG: metalloregulator ArsR/SmtB family transcription factor [Dissulfurispiraceae bacterium]|jgi:ArsR family transcriptional regulator|nr:metalloregulator ArsR/SmtB family transcription factor [Dissulfurispiraceae bacterium]